MNAPAWQPRQPFVSIVTAKAKGLGLARQRLVDVRNNWFALVDAGGEIDAAAPIGDLTARMSAMQVVVAHGEWQRKLNTIPHGTRIADDVLAAYQRHAGAAYVPLSDPARAGTLNALSGGGFGMSKEMAAGNQVLLAVLLGFGARAG